MRRGLSWVLWCVALTLSCDREPSVTADARFGIVYGGQLQERTEVPFELNATKQSQALRVTLNEAASEVVHVQWEVTKPGTKDKPQTTEIQHASIAPGTEQLERVIAFVPGDPLGVWNLRVEVTYPNGEQSLVLDRPFNVYDAAERRHRLKQLRDAGL